MEKIKIYAPVDGEIDLIENLKDGVFSEKMLGDGFYIKPTSNKFYSPIENGKLKMIFDTKHAYYFEPYENVSFLMHIGLDTVSLKGKPFNVKCKQGQNLNLDSEIVEVDFEQISKTDSSISIDTPIVMDLNENKGWTFQIQKKGKVKTGDLIGEFIFSEVKEELNIKDQIEEIINSKSRYEIAAETIYKAVGTHSNYTKVFNCMTRLRFEVKNKESINELEIKRLPIVKGIIWSGNQMQIVIGGEVYKVREAVEDYVIKITSGVETKIKSFKPSIGKRILGAITGIILPSLPVLMAGGLLMGIKTILVVSGAIVDLSSSTNSGVQPDLFSYAFNIVAESGIKLLGIYMGYNTMKYLGGPTLLSIFMGIALSGATTVQFTTIMPSWELFTIGTLTIKTGIFTSSVLPHIFASVIVFYLDKWVKTWMPTSIDVLFRPFLVLLVSFMAVFFMAGPILSLLEQLIGLGVGYLSKIPYGIGTALMALAWQPLVITGMHVPLIMPISIGVNQGIYSTLLFPTNIAVFTQVGVAIAVGIRTKNMQLRQAAFAALPGGIVGVTEPIIYGVNLPKVKPFVVAIVSAAIVGLFAGILGIESRTAGGLGVFGILSTLIEPRLESTVNPNGVTLLPSVNNLFTGEPNSIVLNTVLYGVILFAAVLISCGLGMAFYKERVLESKSIKKQNELLIKYYALVTNQNVEEVKNKLSNITSFTNDIFNQDIIEKMKLVEKDYASIIKTSSKLDSLIINNENKKLSISKTIKKLSKNLESNNLKISNLLAKYKNLENNKKILLLETELKTLNTNRKNLDWFENYQIEVENKLSELFGDIQKETNNDKFALIKDRYWNTIHALDISYMINEPKISKVSKKIFLSNSQ